MAEGIISTANAAGAATAGTGAVSGLMTAVAALSPVTWAVVAVAAAVGVACYIGSNYVKQNIADQDDLAQKAEHTATRERALQSGITSRSQQQEAEYEPVSAGAMPGRRQEIHQNRN